MIFEMVKKTLLQENQRTQISAQKKNIVESANAVTTWKKECEM